MIHPSAHVDPTAEIGVDVQIGPGCVCLAGSRLGDRSRLIANAVVGRNSRLGTDNVLHPGAVIGGDPQDLSYRGEETCLEVGHGNTFREGVTVSRGTVKGGGTTVLGDKNLLMACVHIGHDCHIGNGTILANNVLFAGHTHVGDSAVVAGAAAFHHFVRVGRMAYVGGMSRVVHDVPPGLKVAGDPGRPRQVNVVGLQRNGVSDEEIAHMRLLFRELFRSPEPLKLAAGAATAPPGSFGDELLVFVRQWVGSEKGRYLEDFRTDRPARKVSGEGG